MFASTPSIVAQVGVFGTLGRVAVHGAGAWQSERMRGEVCERSPLMTRSVGEGGA